jgi:hypothetical protein
MGGLLLRYLSVRLSPMCAIVVLGAAVAASAVAAPLSGGRGHDTATGVAAKTIKFVENGSLRLASAPGTTIKEKGSATGTFKGTMVASFTSYSVSSGGFKVIAYFPGGTLSFSGVSRIRVVGATGYAEGTARVSGGTGRFAHASGSGLSYRGVVNRRNYYTTTAMSGRLSF